MKASIISIGDELLSGRTINTNAAYIATELNKLGISIKTIFTIGDNREDILYALQQASLSSALVIISGGLGPTRDDITKTTLCEFFDSRLILDEKALENVVSIFSRRGLPVSEINRQQALVPHNCIVLNNELGTAPGMWFEKNGVYFVSLPGVPFELKNIFEKHVIPKLKNIFHLSPITSKTILTTGIGESALAEKIKIWEDELPENLKLAYLPEPGIVKLRLTAVDNQGENLDKIIEEQVKKLENLIPEYIFGYDDETLQSVIGKLLKKKNYTLSTAESCTGGQIAQMITSVPGCSAYYKGTVVAYDNQVKINVLNVNEEYIKNFGAVSQQVVEAMAVGVKKLLNTDFSVATSGIAGPDGGTPEKPVGLVWIALATPEKVITEKLLLGGDRERNIVRASLASLNLLRKNL